MPNLNTPEKTISKQFTRSVRIYRGDTVVAVIKVRDDLWQLFHEQFAVYHRELVPIINLVDEHFIEDNEDNYEANRVMHFAIKDKP